MIVVVGVPGWRSGDDAGPDGPSARIALAAAAAGAAVELVGRVGDDPDGDALLLALTRAGVGHAAVLRDPARPTPRIAAVTDGEHEPGGAAEHGRPADPEGPQLDAGDLELGLRYVPDFRVLVAADPLSENTLRTIVDATAYSGARLVVLADESPPSEALPPSATVLQRPADDVDGAFATLVGTYAATLDRGEPPDRAFRAAVTAVGGQAAED